MFRAIEIQEKLLHLIGWQQSYKPDEVKIAEKLTESESGLYFQQAHPLITLTNLACIAPTFNSEDDKENVANFSKWLEDKTKGSIQKAISRFYNEKLIQGEAKSLCENKTLFNGTGRLVDLVKNKNNVVGFEVVPIRAKGVITKINKIGLQFTKPGNYKLYLMQSGSAKPIQTITLTKEKANTMEWFHVNLELPYQYDGIDAGGSWYLVYAQSELPEESQAIRKDKDWSKSPCTSCSKADLISWQAWSRFLEIHPFSVNEEFTITDEAGNLTLWDVENNMYDYGTNYGINLDVTVACDYTDFIIEQRSIFQDIIMKQVAIDLLREFAYNANTRTNRNSINASKLDIIVAIEGSDNGEGLTRTGLSQELANAMKAIKLSTRGIDRVCQPCVTNGIRYRSI